MKIAQIVCVYPPYKGGIGTSALAIARIFKSAGQEIKTFTLKSPLERGGLAPREDGVCDGGEQDKVLFLKAIPKFGNGGFLPQLFWKLKDFDLIYLHYPFFGAAEIIWFLKKFVWGKKKRLVIQYHMDVVLSNLFLKFLSLPSVLIFNSLFKNADLIISASKDYVANSKLKDIYQKYSAAAIATEDEPAKFVEIPFGVDMERFKPYFCHPDPALAGEGSDSSKTHEVDNNKKSFLFAGGNRSFAEAVQDDKKRVVADNNFNILFVGGLDKAHYFKGVDVLLDALNLLNKENSNWRLVIAGEGDRRAVYEKKARDLGIADKVNFVGSISNEDLPQKYQAADCFVLPSINKGEAFGIVLIEAMASGLPVIASDLPGVRGVFTKDSGLKIRPDDAEDLKNKIKFLMENPEECKIMGVNARKEAGERYGQDMVKEKLISVITNIK